MVKSLLSAAIVAALAGSSVATPAPAPGFVTKPASVAVKNVKSDAKAASQSKKLAPGVSLSVVNGMKRLQAPGRAAKSLRANANRTICKANIPEGYVLYESFEDWDGDDLFWTPEGWVVDMRGDVDREESWTPAEQDPYHFLPGPSDGQYYFGVNFSTGNQDEWLISPYVTVEEGMDLTYWLYLDPGFLYSLENVDWDTFEFIGDPEVAATLQIWAQEEGAEWVMLRDYADEYREYTLSELFDMSPTSLEKNQVSLADYYGKKTRVAFRYVGTDGNTMFIDAIGIGYPSLDDLWYTSPLETLYWGFKPTANLEGLTAAIAQYPVYSPLTWVNQCPSDATYSWTYCDPVTGNFLTSDDPEELTVTYVPDYRSAASKKNNLFYPPTLHGEAPHTTPGQYTAPYTYFQAGGKAEYSLNDGTEFEASLLPFNYHELSLGITTVDDEQLGDASIPVFGHSPNTDAYWLNYSLNGETPNESDYNRLTGIANLYVPPTEAALVVNGVVVYGYGKINDAALLKATVYALNSEWSSEFSTFEVIASASISGADIIRQDPQMGYLCLPFDFETPAVLQSTEEHPAYMIMLEGFNSDEVVYFAPIQSAIDNPAGGAAYMMSEIDLSSQTGREPYTSIKAVVYKVGDEYYDPATSFAFGLDAEYPWLTTDCEKIEFNAETREVSVPLGSYYDGAQLTVNAPAGTIATVSGRYDECVLKVELTDAAVVVNGDVVVEGPGVKVSIPVSYEPNGIAVIAADSSAIAAIYYLTGAKVDRNNVTAGLYLVRYADGSVRKVILK